MINWRASERGEELNINTMSHEKGGTVGGLEGISKQAIGTGCNWSSKVGAARTIA